MNWIEAVTRSRARLPVPATPAERVAEGGCGVIGFASTLPVAGRHLFQALSQMRNRGNGKGGGIAAVGLDPAQFGTTAETLAQCHLLAIAYLDQTVQEEVEALIADAYSVEHRYTIPVLDDWRSLAGLDVQPPAVTLYFVRPASDALADFASRFQPLHGRQPTDRELNDEYVYQTSFRLNAEFYAGTRGTKAFVLSHGRNLLVLKMVGYAEDVIRYYRLEEVTAHVWIGHHRYPTKGKVWHPGGAHPFIGLNEALVHNGDFANYASICDYLAQRRIKPLFQTDTEVAALVFDLHHRLYDYPLEYVIESLAPTTERDFTLLPDPRREIYRHLQTTHIHGSPDGPWFFIIAHSAPDAWRLIGITDTSMLRPQVFALQQGRVSIAVAASEKQVIDAALESLAAEDDRFWTRADRYWNARGGSHTDGGAFIFSVSDGPDGKRLQCTNKFGEAVELEHAPPCYQDDTSITAKPREQSEHFSSVLATGDASAIADAFIARVAEMDYTEADGFLRALAASAEQGRRAPALAALTLLIDRRYPTGRLRRSLMLSRCDTALARIFDGIREAPDADYWWYDLDTGEPEPSSPDQTLVIDARRFAIEGQASLALALARLFRKGWRRFIVAHARGHRFIANGLCSETRDVRIDVYGSSGDYLASGIDGATVVVHNNAQDQLAQIMKEGTLVVHGDVGQTFMYAAKGGEAYVLGNAAGRPLINAVGRPRVVINGTCLDYLAESFMAGDPLDGGGFVVLNGLGYNDAGELVELSSPYPGGNLFSLASGGAIYLRDPHLRVTSDQLNGGEFGHFGDADWELIHPYLERNAAHFGIPVARLLAVDDEPRLPEMVYRKVQPARVKALQAEEIWAAEAGA